MAEEQLPPFIEDDESARARAFWKAHGKPIIAGVIIGLGGIVGFNYWKSSEQAEGENASFLFERLRSGQEGIDMSLLTTELKKEYASTSYVELATFALARQFVEKNNLESAAQELAWVADHSTDSGFRHIARLRLASVLLGQQKPTHALEILSVTDEGSFGSRYYELLGDAYLQRSQSKQKQDGDSAQAKSEYQKCLETLPQGAAHAKLIQLKLDNVENTPANTPESTLETTL